MGAADFTAGERAAILANALPHVSEPDHLAGVEPYPMTPLSQWLGSHPPPLEPILDGLFERGDKVEIIAPSKSRKSFLAMQLGLCIASGVDFIGIDVAAASRVLLCQLEVKPAWFHRRARRMAEAMDIDESGKASDGLCFLNLRGVTFDPLALERTALDFGADVIIIDPIYMLLAGSENDIEAWRPIVSMFDRMAERSGCAVIYIHHDAKGFAGSRSIQDRGAGSNILGRSCDARITLTPHAQDDDCQVLETMNRNYPPREAVTIEFNGAYFTASDLHPVKQTGPTATNKNPLNDIPEAEFFPKVDAFCEAEGLLATERFKIRLGDHLGTTRAKTRDIYKAAIDDGIIWKTKKQGRGGAALIGQPRQVKAYREPEL